MKSYDKYEKKLQDMRTEYVKRIDAIHKDTHHEDQPVEKDFAEQVVQRENDDVLDALGEDARQTVMKIDNALLRIKSGEYGVCKSCGLEIPEQRLEVVPFAELCIDCAEDEARH
ncbi:MAG: TraR/DksA family transcriptional regulator [Gammaproteobacteria bacterium]|nr:TraR/DksA family transcriptional regulator [Gammaproteobacteria bacterium]